jgi:hypothetical protein
MGDSNQQRSLIPVPFLESPFSMDWNTLTSSRREYCSANVNCPHHPLDTAWWWSLRCSICALRTDKNTRPVAFAGNGAEDIDPDYIFGRWPHVSASMISISRLPPCPGSKQAVADSRSFSTPVPRRKRKSRFPRLGSDTNPLSFTGKVLGIRREGLEAIGRQFDPSRSTNANGQPWKF